MKWLFGITRQSMVVALLTCMVVLVVGAVGIYLHEQKLIAVVVNHGPGTLRSVIVHVRGNSYPMGDLDAGELRSVAIHPDRKTGVAIEFVGETGETVRTEEFGYMGPDY